MRCLHLLFAMGMACLELLGAEGAYSGSWTSDRTSSGGKIEIQLKTQAAVSFTLEGETVACKVVSSKVNEGGLEIQYDFEFGGNKLRSTISGTATPEKLSGKYVTKTVADGSPVDSGTFAALVAK